MFKNLFLVLLAFNLISCEDFVEVDAPESRLTKEVVFNSDDTASSAMTGIYNQLFLSSFSGGHFDSVTLLSGLSGGLIENFRTTYPSRLEFEEHQLQADNSDNFYLWSSAYNTIYMTNSMLEGLWSSQNISPELKMQLEGEARFIRAFTYFYLTNLYGDVPLILSTDYSENRLAGRDPAADVYSQIIADLQIAQEQLDSEYPEGDRTRVNKFAATALLARVHLYLENWQQAEALSTQVIQQTSHFQLLNNLDEVFLANSMEAIWQISPIGGGGYMTQTNEGNIFIIDPVFSFMAAFKLDEKFPENFEDNDKRLRNWIGFNEAKESYFPYKYKIQSSSSFPIVEYSMVLRLAEQYLIRAEARAHLGDLEGAIEDIDAIRARAGLSLLAEIDRDLDQDALLDIIFEERMKELFGEWGHRWLDLKRSGRIEDVFANVPNWETTDELYPIPEEERKKNSNLGQNAGY